jgi:signal peptidase II
MTTGLTAPEKDRRPLLFLVAAAVFAADRVTKIWVQNHILLGRARVVIPRVFRISHVLNTGAAFSLFAGDAHVQLVRWGLIAFSAVAILLMLGLIVQYGRSITMNTFAFALILGGAAGNMFDRIRIGEVIDFLEVHIGHYHYPDFNVADSCIVIGGVLIFLASLRSTEAK